MCLKQNGICNLGNNTAIAELIDKLMKQNMRNLKTSFAILLTIMAFSCTENINLEDTRPSAPAGKSIPSKDPKPGFGDDPVTSSYITVHYGVEANKEEFYEQVSQILTILNVENCPGSDIWELWHVTDITLAEFNEIFGGIGNVATYTASNTKSEDPYAKDLIYVYFGNTCQ